jgi:ABC-type Mn2+/Zn2+ transport system permease subunit
MSWSDLWNYEFLRYALLSALILGPTCALLGVFVTLRGMAFFSDALAHSAITGVAIGFLLEEHMGLALDPMWFVLLFSLALAMGMAWMSRNSSLAPDTVIAFSFTGSVALGVVIISWLGKYRLLDGILFGSIYANDLQDVIRQAILSVVVIGFLVSQMRGYALSTLSPELAHVQRLPSRTLHYLFALLIAATVALSLKMLGALLLSALIVIPAAAAKLVCGSFRAMLLIALAIGLLVPAAGVWTSCQLNLPTGPTIVLANVLLLAACYFAKSVRTLFTPSIP